MPHSQSKSARSGCNPTLVDRVLKGGHFLSAVAGGSKLGWSCGVLTTGGTRPTINPTVLINYVWRRLFCNDFVKTGEVKGHYFGGFSAKESSSRGRILLSIRHQNTEARGVCVDLATPCVQQFIHSDWPINPYPEGCHCVIF